MFIVETKIIENLKDKYADKIFFNLVYMSGVGVAYEYKEVYICQYSDYKPEFIIEIYNNYKIVNDLIEGNNNIYDINDIPDGYDEIIYEIYADTPYDTYIDEEVKASLTNIEIYAYDKELNKIKLEIK